jgi:hypothetical protein
VKYGSLILIGLFVVPICSATEDVLSDAATLRVNKFLELLASARAEGEPPVQDNLDKYSATLEEMVKGRPVVTLHTEYWVVDVAGDTGEVYSYGRKAMSDEEKARADVLTRANALTEEAAFKIFLPLAEYLGQPSARTDYNVRFVDYQASEKGSIPEIERNLDGCDWEIRRDFSYRGVPCRRRRLSVAISPITGRIGSMLYWPVVIPQTEARNVSREQAVKIASAWLKVQPRISESVGRRASVGEGAAEKAEWVIACPNTFLNGTQSSAERYVGPVAFYSWEVPFQYEEPGETVPHLFNAVLWVDAYGGKVIGGSNVR